MNKLRSLKIAMGLLSLLLLISLGLFARALWVNHCWKEAMDDIASQAGVASASLDFRKGNMVLWAFEGTDINVHYSGRHDGPFEVWVDAYYPDNPWPMEYARRKVAAVHNEYLRHMYEHPDKFLENMRKEPRARRGESRPEDK
jgi:hypothetical protein